MTGSSSQQPYSDEAIRGAASESVRQGEHIRERVREVTLQALRERRFDGPGVRAVIRAVTEGVATGAGKSRTEMRYAISEALTGLDQALRTSAEAGTAALKQLSSTGRSFSDNELKQAIGTMRRLEEDFFDTVGQVAEGASTQVQPQLREALANARRTGTATGRQVALTLGEFAQRFSIASLDATVAGLEVASEVGQRFAALTSGLLSGVAEALRPVEPPVHEETAAAPPPPAATEPVTPAAEAPAIVVPAPGSATPKSQ